MALEIWTIRIKVKLEIHTAIPRILGKRRHWDEHICLRQNELSVVRNGFNFMMCTFRQRDLQ